MCYYRTFNRGNVDWKQTTAGCGNSKQSTPFFFFFWGGLRGDAAESQMSRAIDKSGTKHKELDAHSRLTAHSSHQSQIF